MAVVLGTVLGPESSDQRGTRAEAEALLQQVIEKVDIKAAGNPPFLLTARVLVRNQRKELIEGTYKLLWKSPELWREEIRFPDFWQIRLEKGETLWESRNLPYVSTPIYRVSSLWDSFRRLQAFPGEKIEKIVEAARGGQALRWIEVKWDGKVRKRIFVDPSKLVPIRLEYGEKGGAGGTEFLEFTKLGDRFFPFIIQTMDEKDAQDILQVEVLKETVFDDPGVFEPSADARSMPWCPNPIWPSQKEIQSNFNLPPGINPPPGAAPIPPNTPSSAFGKHVTVYGVVGTDGQWRGLTIVDSGGKAADDLFLAILRQQRYHPATCNGKPIDFEMVEEIAGS